MNPQLWQTINWIKGKKNKRDWSFYRSSRRLTIPRNIPHRRFRMQTCNPQISGDLGGLEDFGEVDLSQPPVEWAGSDELAAAPPEVIKNTVSHNVSDFKGFNQSVTVHILGVGPIVKKGSVIRLLNMVALKSGTAIKIWR